MQRPGLVAQLQQSDLEHRDEPEALATITLLRPENNGRMNSIASRLLIDGPGVVSAAISNLEAKPPTAVPWKRGLPLIGGDTLVLSVRPGRYSLQVVTPVVDQQSYLDSTWPWRSSTSRVTVSSAVGARMVICPTAQGSAYDGGWTLTSAETDLSIADCQ